MEVKILQSVTSPTYSYAAGQTVKLEKARADEFIKHKIAENIEKATKKAPKKADKK